MAWPYNPKDASECLPEGEYDASIATVEEKISKSGGNPMLAVGFSVPMNGRQWTVRDYIVNPSSLFKLKQISRCFGKLADFDAGLFDLAQFKGRALRLVLAVESEPGFADKNVIKAFKETNGAVRRPAATQQDDADIPF